VCDGTAELELARAGGHHLVHSALSSTAAALRLRVCALQPRAGDAATAAVVACDGRVRDGAAPAAPSALLLALPPGAYTVARTLGGTRLVDWECVPDGARKRACLSCEARSER